MPGSIRRRASSPFRPKQLALSSDLPLAIGGDGTVLHAMRLAAAQGVPR
jgi:NAD kinase